MLHLNTIDPFLYQILKDFSVLPELNDFFLVGGTSLALQMGHRKSDDLDFFTNSTFSVSTVKAAIFNYSPTFELLNETKNGISFLLNVEENPVPQRKIDIYNWAVKFIRPPMIEDNIKLASLEDIAAFKLEAICHRKEKKDYVDIAVLLQKFSFGDLMSFYQEKYPYADKRVVLSQITDVQDIEKSMDPVMLADMEIVGAIAQIENKVHEYSKFILDKQLQAEKEREQKIRDLLAKKKY